MNLLYITSVWGGFEEPNMHLDFVSEAVKRGHKVTVLALSEKRNNEQTRFFSENGIDFLTVRCGNIQKTGKYEKVISSLRANYQIYFAARKYLKGKKFDLVVWSVATTLIYFGTKKITRMLKTRQYLLLKEYWPQDPVDLGAMSEGGIVFKFFKYVERHMLSFADRIGTSSPGGIDYVLSRYPENEGKCEVCPHCETVRDVDSGARESIRAKYGFSPDEKIFVYGGNFGLSQGIDDMISCVRRCEDLSVRFVLLGGGTEYDKVKESLSGQKNVTFFGGMRYLEFFSFASACDCGLIFLFKGYHVPNIPGKLNTYLNCEIPIISCVDSTTDLGSIIEEGGVGIKVSSGDAEGFRNAVIKIAEDGADYKKNCKKLLVERFTPDHCLDKIEKFAER